MSWALLAALPLVVAQAGGTACPMHGEGGACGKQVSGGIRYLSDLAGGRGFAQYVLEKQRALGIDAPFPNPAVGFSLSWGLNLASQNASENLMTMGLLHTHRVDLGPVALGWGFVLGGGVHAAYLSNLTFQDTYAFLSLEPRLSLGFSPHERVRVSLVGSYLLTTRMSQLQGPAATLQVTFGRF